MKKGMYTYTINYCHISNVWGIFETKDKKRVFPIFSHKDLFIVKRIYSALAYGGKLEVDVY